MDSTVVHWWGPSSDDWTPVNHRAGSLQWTMDTDSCLVFSPVKERWGKMMPPTCHWIVWESVFLISIWIILRALLLWIISSYQTVISSSDLWLLLVAGTFHHNEPVWLDSDPQSKATLKQSPSNISSTFKMRKRNLVIVSDFSWIGFVPLKHKK